MAEFTVTCYKNIDDKCFITSPFLDKLCQKLVPLGALWPHQGAPGWPSLRPGVARISFSVPLKT